MNTRLTLVLCAMLAAACGPSLEGIVAEHGEEGRADLAKLTAVFDDCRALAPLEEDDLPEGVTGVVFADRLDRPEGNARTIWLDAYDDQATWMEPVDWSYLERDRWWRMTSAALSDQPPEFEKRDLTHLPGDFAALDSTEYVLVLRKGEYTAPTYEGDNRFQLGRMKGELHLYRVLDGARLGGMRYVAFGAGIDFGGFDLTLDSSKPEQSVRTLVSRLYGNIHDFATARLAAAVPGVDSLYEWERGGGFIADKIRRRR